jgi:hypothetical protein
MQNMGEVEQAIVHFEAFLNCVSPENPHFTENDIEYAKNKIAIITAIFEKELEEEMVESSR